MAKETISKKGEKTKKGEKNSKAYTRREFLKKSGVIAVVAAATSVVGPFVLRGASKPIKIGTVFPLTGPLARIGTESLRGVELCVEEQNRRGGIKGREIVLINKDAPNPDAAVAAVESLATVEKVDVATGCYSSTITYAATAKAAALNLPFWVAPAIADAITDRKLRNVFRVSSIASDYGIYAAMMCAEIIAPKLGKKPEDLRVAVLYEDGLWGTTVSKFAIKKMRELKMKVVMSYGYDKETPDLSPVITKLKSIEPDVLAHAGYTHDAALFWSQAKALNFYVPAATGLGGGYSSREFREAIGKAAIGLLQVDYTPYNTNPKFAKGLDKLAQAYREKYKEPPYSCHSPCTYANMQVLFEVLEKAKSFDVKGIEEAALAMDKPLGTYVTGWGVKFDPETHQNLKAPPFGFQWQPDYRTDDILFPERHDGIIVPYAIYPEEARLPGTEVKWIPLPTWEEREKL